MSTLVHIHRHHIKILVMIFEYLFFSQIADWILCWKILNLCMVTTYASEIVSTQNMYEQLLRRMRNSKIKLGALIKKKTCSIKYSVEYSDVRHRPNWIENVKRSILLWRDVIWLSSYHRKIRNHSINQSVIFRARRFWIRVTDFHCLFYECKLKFKQNWNHICCYTHFCCYEFDLLNF